MSAPRYQWPTPGDWLLHHIERQGDDCDAVVKLDALCREIASYLDDDTVQHIFQAEMDDDGYFQELDGAA